MANTFTFTFWCLLGRGDVDYLNISLVGGGGKADLRPPRPPDFLDGEPHTYPCDRQPCLVLVEEAGIRVVLQGESFVCLRRFLVLKPVLVEGVFSFFSIVYFPGFIWGYLSCPIYWSTVL